MAHFGGVSIIHIGDTIWYIGSTDATEVALVTLERFIIHSECFSWDIMFEHDTQALELSKKHYSRVTLV